MGFSTRISTICIFFTLCSNTIVFSNRASAGVFFSFTQCIRNALVRTEENSELLLTENTQARNNYLNAISNLHANTSGPDSLTTIRRAYEAQTQYCETYNQLTKRSHRGYEVVPVLEKYIGEDVAKSIESRQLAVRDPQLAQQPIKYLTTQEAENFQAHESEGKLVLKKGHRLKNLFAVEYIMDTKGEIYILDRRSVGFNDAPGSRGLRHSSISRHNKYRQRREHCPDQ